nr:HNH endonuclease [Parabacteroides goldsteinii]
MKEYTHKKIKQYVPVYRATQKRLMEIEDKSYNSSIQRKMLEAISNGSTIQRLQIGKEPKIPNNFRQTNIPNNTTRSNKGFEQFSEVVKDYVYRQNVQQSTNITLSAPLPATIPGAISDNSGIRLMDRDQASDISPEVDHIVEKSHGGSNSVNNARVLSKSENMSNNIRRPSDDEIGIVVYRNTSITKEDQKEDILAGQALSNDQVSSVMTFGQHFLGAVRAKSGSTKHGITITQE